MSPDYTGGLAAVLASFGYDVPKLVVRLNDEILAYDGAPQAIHVSPPSRVDVGTVARLAARFDATRRRRWARAVREAEQAGEVVLVIEGPGPTASIKSYPPLPMLDSFADVADRAVFNLSPAMQAIRPC